MDEREYWIKFCKYVFTFACVFVMTLSVSCQSTKYQIRKSIESGANPIEAACAIRSASDTVGDSVCMAEIMKSDK